MKLKIVLFTTILAKAGLFKRFAQWRDILQSARSADHHRRMEETLQHKETTQCIRL